MFSPLPVDSQDKAYQLEPAATVSKRRMVFGSSLRSLQGAQEEFFFFTPAPLYLWGRFGDHVLVDFLDQVGASSILYYALFDQPVFVGLESRRGDRAWNYALWATPVVYREALIQHFVASTQVDWGRREIFSVGFNSILINDPLYCDRMIIVSPSPPQLEIGVFGVRSNKFDAAIERQANEFQPKLRVYTPDEANVRYAEALFSHQDPHLAQTMKAQEPHEN